MTISLKHSFVSSVPDSGDADVVQPSNWNEEHDLTLAADRIVGRLSTAGAAQELTADQIAGLISDDTISGDKIDGGTISDFASTGIDDNATSTKVTITNTGLGIGETSPSVEFHISSSLPDIRLEDTDDSSYGQITAPSGSLYYYADGGNVAPATSHRFYVDGTGSGSQRLGIFDGSMTFGSNTSGSIYGLLRGANDGYHYLSGGTALANGATVLLYGGAHATLASDWSIRASGSDVLAYDYSASTLAFSATAGTEAMRLTTTGLGIGISSPDNKLQVARTALSSVPALGAEGTHAAFLDAASDYGMLFGTRATGHGFIQQQRVDGTATAYDLWLQPNGGDVGIAETAPDSKLEVAGTGRFTDDLKVAASGVSPSVTSSGNTNIGITARETGDFFCSANSSNVASFNRQSTDGGILVFYQDGTQEGSVTVSGTTVSYNAFVGSHPSQLETIPPSPLLRGTIMESIDDFSEDQGRDSRMPKVKVSDTADTKAVYGTILGQIRNEDTGNLYDDQYYISAVGLGFVRLASGQVPEQGDAIVSNGDGTGKILDEDTPLTVKVMGSIVCWIRNAIPIEEFQDGSQLFAASFDKG